MILDKLTLRNFCLFAGKQTFDLSPVQRNGKARPIVLFGGMNGGGKTTLFDAIQLALYGPRARCSKRARLSYEEFLLQSVHHGVSPFEGAGVALAFKHSSDGRQHDYVVCRDWQVQEGKLRETLLVLMDRQPDYTLGRNWPQLVEELVPLEISQLFFFDGEKIRTLAEDAGGAEALGAAVKALLGLDIVERLVADAAVVQTRLAKQLGTPEQRAAVEGLERQVEEIDSRIRDLGTELSSLENRRQRAEEEVRKVEEEFAAVGGRHWEERHARRQRLGELTALVTELEGRLVALAAGDLPLALVPDLLKSVAGQDAREVEAIEAEVVQRLLEERDRRLLEVLRDARPASDLLRRAEAYLAEDRAARRPAAAVERRLLLSEGGRALLRQLRDRRLAELGGTADEVLRKLEQAAREREALERALQATLAEADIGAVVGQLKTATENLTLLNDQARRLDVAIGAGRAERAHVQKQLQRLWESDAAKQFAREDGRRMIELAGRTRTTMQELRRRGKNVKERRGYGVLAPRRKTTRKPMLLSR